MTQNQTVDAAFHGGASFEALGFSFEHLERIPQIVSADVLDAWFPPSPEVIEVLMAHLSWAVRSSPPTGCEGLVKAISLARGVPAEALLVGAGSSSLIFLALRQFLSPSSRALILEPSYGEYAHVLQNVLGCRVDRFVLRPEKDFDVDPDELAERITDGYDLVVLVNPNNPTGRHIPRSHVERLAENAPSCTRFWIDETYVDFVDSAQSLEGFAADSDNVIVCKSMSKVYALSGLRVGYLCGPPKLIGPLRRLSPPWAVSLPGQLAAVTALESAEYYGAKYEETGKLRQELACHLESIEGMRVVPGAANFLMLMLPESGPPTESVLARCRSKGLFLRDPAATTPSLGDRTLRIAVKDRQTNLWMAEIIRDSIFGR